MRASGGTRHGPKCESRHAAVSYPQAAAGKFGKGGKNGKGGMSGKGKSDCKVADAANPDEAMNAGYRDSTTTRDGTSGRGCKGGKNGKAADAANVNQVTNAGYHGSL